ncbi:MAG: hypothetical protein J6W09_06705 [Bacteroidales bacterium]|nr:hypothetical protein [Bacteroidales bacterium]
MNTQKKAYLSPETQVERLQAKSQILAGSRINGKAGNGQNATGAYWTYEDDDLTW